MTFTPANIVQDEELLGQLAMKFRGTRCEPDRAAIAAEYADTVTRLISTGLWHEMPPPEDQLPDDRMPPAFFGYWTRQSP